MTTLKFLVGQSSACAGPNAAGPMVAATDDNAPSFRTSRRFMVSSQRSDGTHHPMRFGGEPEMDQRVAAAKGARSSPVNARTPSPAPRWSARRPTDDSPWPGCAGVRGLDQAGKDDS